MRNIQFGAVFIKGDYWLDLAPTSREPIADGPAAYGKTG
jgi:hypothetical protein